MDSTDKPRVDFPVHRTALPRGTRKCRACGAPIYFYRHPATGRPMPLDVGSKVLSDGGSYYRLEAHFAHCTNPDAFRARKSAPPAPRPRSSRGMTEAERERRELFGDPSGGAE